jgi:hypothetical protein
MTSDLAAIPRHRSTDAGHDGTKSYGVCRQCLAHIDALTAKVNERFDDAARYMGKRDGMVYGDVSDEWGMTRATVLDILEGKDAGQP